MALTLRLLARSSFMVGVGLGAASLLVGACGDDDVGPAAPGPADAQPDNSSRLPPNKRDSEPPDEPITDAGRDARAEAGADAKAPDASDAGDDAGPVDASTPDADASPVDAGDTPLGTGPLSIVYSGGDVGAQMRKLETATFATTSLVAWTSTGGSFAKGTTTVTNVGTVDAIDAWGRWAGGIASVDGNNFTWPANGGVLYVVGRRPGTIPSSGTSTLTTAGSPGAILGNGTVTPGTLTGTAAITYPGGGVAKVGLSLTLVVGAQTYSIFSSGGGSTNPSTSELTTDADGFFSADYPIAAATPLCGGVGGQCTGRVRGFVSGASADHVAAVLHVFNNPPGDLNTLSGAIVFKK